MEEKEEAMFAIVTSDPAAAYTLRQWCKERIRIGMNLPTDKIIEDARALADYFEKHAPPVPPRAATDDVKVVGTATVGEDFKVSGSAE